jgi:hypothetical protein
LYSSSYSILHLDLSFVVLNVSYKGFALNNEN